MPSVGCHHVRPVLTNTCQSSPTWLSCKLCYRNMVLLSVEPPYKEGVSYRLGWFFVIVHSIVPSNALFSDPPVLCRTIHCPPNCRWLVAVLPQGNVEFHFKFFFTALFGGCGDGGAWQSCGSMWEMLQQQKHNCSMSWATARVFVSVKRESGTPVLHLSQIALLIHCSPSLRHVAYQHHNGQWMLGVQRSSLQWRTCTLSHRSLLQFSGTGMLTWILLSPRGSTSKFTSGLTENTMLNLW